MLLRNIDTKLSSHFLFTTITLFIIPTIRRIHRTIINITFKKFNFLISIVASALVTPFFTCQAHAFKSFFSTTLAKYIVVFAFIVNALRATPTPVLNIFVANYTWIRRFHWNNVSTASRAEGWEKVRVNLAILPINFFEVCQNPGNQKTSRRFPEFSQKKKKKILNTNQINSYNYYKPNKFL